jgi:hypothetical protein
MLNVALDVEAGQTPLSIQQGMRLGCRDALALGLAIFATHATFKIIRGNWRWIWSGFKPRTIDKDMDAMGILGARHTSTTGPSVNANLSPSRRQIEATLACDETLFPTYFQWRYELLDFACKSAFLIALHGLGSTFLGIKYLSVSQEALLSIVPYHTSLSTSSLVSAIPSVAVWASSRAIQFPFSITLPGLLGHNLISLCAICWSCYPQFIVETAAVSLVGGGGDLDQLDVSACEQVFQVVTGIPPQRLSIRQLQQFSEFSATIALGANGQDSTPNSTRAGACLLLNILQVLIATRKASPSLQPVRFLDEIEECSFENPENDEEIECTICLAGFDGNDVPFKLKKCGHTFHVQCLGQWLAAQHQCPLCRHDIKVVPLPSSSESSDGSGDEDADHLPSIYERRLTRGFSPLSFRPRLTCQPVVRAWINDGVEGDGGMAIHNIVIQGVLLAGLTDLGWVFTRGNTCGPTFDCMEDAVDYIREVLLAEIITSMLHKLLGASFAPSPLLDMSPEFHQQQEQIDGPEAVLGRTLGLSDRIRTQAHRRQYLLRYGKFWVSCMIRMRSFHQAQISGITTPWHRLVYYAFAMSLSVFTPLI